MKVIYFVIALLVMGLSSCTTDINAFCFILYYLS